MQENIFYLLLILAFVLSSNEVRAQRAFLGFPSDAIQEACRISTSVTAAQVTQWEKESVNCVDRFEQVQEAACFHACILQKYGLTDDDHEPIMEAITGHVDYINAKQVENITIECYNSFQGIDPCFRSYHVHKCIDKSIGIYPYGAKHVPIDNVLDNVGEVCRIRLGMTNGTLCKYEQATDFDRCESTPLPRCYHQCILIELGYVQNGNYPNIRTYRRRYFYIKDMEFVMTFFDCWFSLKYSGRCSAMYQMYKCMKLKIGEYPPKAFKPIQTDE